jgi:hypothetical protein
MVADKLGHVVANGEVYLVAGEVRLQKASDLVIVADRQPHHADAGDVFRATDALGFQTDMSRNELGGTGLTTVGLDVASLLRHPTASKETPVRRPFNAIGAAVLIAHNTAGGPWTGWNFNVYKNGSTTASATLAVSVASSGFANNLTHGNLSSVVNFIAGDRWWANLTGGTALDAVVVTAILYAEYDAAP